MRDPDDISAPPEEERLTDPKDILIRNLRWKVHQLQNELDRLKCLESWRTNPDRMGS